MEALTKALLVDDDPLLIQMYETALKLDGFEVFVAHTGTEGIEIAKSANPDVIVLDLMMPEMNGWDACREIRRFYTGPILMVSAVVDSTGVMRALESGADDYLVKPIPHNVLASRLKRLVRQARLNSSG